MFRQTITLTVAVGFLFSALAAAKDWEFMYTQGMIHLMRIERTKERSEQVYQDAIRQLCEVGKHCYINFFVERRADPRQFPQFDTEGDAKVAQFVRNPTTHFEQFLWNCRIKNDPKICFRVR